MPAMDEAEYMDAEQLKRKAEEGIQKLTKGLTEFGFAAFQGSWICCTSFALLC